MKKIIVAGCGTDVGKTVVSAILVNALRGDYWKPIQCGNIEESDSKTIREWVPSMEGRIHSPTYELKTPVSPHHAARIEGIHLDPAKIIPPITERPLIIESSGGVLVPLNEHTLTLSPFMSWMATWIIVSRHYIGSINHTLLTVEALKKRGVAIHSIIFNGDPNPDTEQAILHFTGLPCIGRLLPECVINHKIIERYANQWKKQLQDNLR